ncbi:hypothetical protein [Streptomyces sp. PSAA01]|uniref:hypothetical protein n=1 Tax=Streptomyces sp. PSAA01 TaxID=2912762 RepID=UPI001F4628F0|nr:hypothetical protein [Streptomyces sp. PSAA01]MCG0283801.1 hypothetical protein [Streptomyces sp. PSAA01]
MRSGAVDPFAMCCSVLGDRLMTVRAQILPGLRAGRVVVVDRCLFTPLGGLLMHGAPEQARSVIEPLFSCFPAPDLAVFRTVPTREADRRVRRRPDERDDPLALDVYERRLTAFRELASANGGPLLDTALRDAGAGVEVTGDFDWRLARRHGFPPHRTVANAVRRSERQREERLTSGAGVLIVDGGEGLDDLCRTARRTGVRPGITVRVNVLESRNSSAPRASRARPWTMPPHSCPPRSPARNSTLHAVGEPAAGDAYCAGSLPAVNRGAVAVARDLPRPAGGPPTATRAHRPRHSRAESS